MLHWLACRLADARYAHAPNIMHAGTLDELAAQQMRMELDAFGRMRPADDAYATSGYSPPATLKSVRMSEIDRSLAASSSVATSAAGSESSMSSGALPSASESWGSALRL